MGNDSLRVGDRVVALNEIEARVVAAEAKVRNEGTLFSGATLTDAAAGFWLIADAQALLSEVRRLRAVERAAQAVVDCEAGDARARLLARLALILAAAPPKTGG